MTLMRLITIKYFNRLTALIYINECSQLNALLTALTQTNFNAVNFFFFSLAQNKEAVA